jgi:hypothetical protein
MKTRPSIHARRTALVRARRRRRTATVTLVALVITIITRAAHDWVVNGSCSGRSRAPLTIVTGPPE